MICKASGGATFQSSMHDIYWRRLRGWAHLGDSLPERARLHLVERVQGFGRRRGCRSWSPITGPAVHCHSNHLLGPWHKMSRQCPLHPHMLHKESRKGWQAVEITVSQFYQGARLLHSGSAWSKDCRARQCQCSSGRSTEADLTTILHHNLLDIDKSACRSD